MADGLVEECVMGSDADRFANLDVGQEILPAVREPVVPPVVRRGRRYKEVGLGVYKQVGFGVVPAGFSNEYELWQMRQGPWCDRSWRAFQRYLDQKGKVG